MAHPLQDPAYLGRKPPEYRDAEHEYDFFANPDANASRMAIGLGGLVAVFSLIIAMTAGSPSALLIGAAGVGLAGLGGVNLYLSYLWRKPALGLWQRALIVVPKAVVVICLMPVVLVLVLLQGVSELFTGRPWG